MQTKVKALDSFFHGRVSAERGSEYQFPKGEADELVKAGLAEIVSHDDGEAQEPAPADEKMSVQLENKMAESPANKRAKK
jgi:hypothetical protein